MMITPTVKIECRYCLGDGFITVGYSKPAKVQCQICEGRKSKWINRADLRDSDVIVKR